jgi:glycosyltransferase involved in cell wall biosynthesis
VSVLMPAYQLEAEIAANIDRTVDALRELPGVEIIVCDDGSTDGCRAAAEQAAARHDNVSVVGYTPNRGKGAALQAAFAASRGEIVVFLDADLDLPPEQVPAFLQRQHTAGVDVLVGAKQQSMEPGRYPALRRVLSKTFSLVTSLLFRLPVDETQTGLKSFRRGTLRETLPHLETLRYSFDLELIVRINRAGYSIAAAPVELAVGASATGVSLRTLWEMGRDTFLIWIRSFTWPKGQS